jgi:hypothetical protein
MNSVVEQQITDMSASGLRALPDRPVMGMKVSITTLKKVEVQRRMKN